MSKSLELQKWIFDALTSCGLPSYTHNRHDSDYPFALIGGDAVSEHRFSKTHYTEKLDATIEVFTQENSYAEVKQLVDSFNTIWKQSRQISTPSYKGSRDAISWVIEQIPETRKNRVPVNRAIIYLSVTLHG
jgi:hypothetical protein